MERLTFEGNFCDIAKCTSAYIENCVCSQRKVWERLKYYEDLEEQGRLVVLPCKVGDTVWAWWSDEDGKYIDNGVVFAIGVDERKTMWISVRYDSGLPFYHPSSDIGKIVFLTREEAEAALKKG